MRLRKAGLKENRIRRASIVTMALLGACLVLTTTGCGTDGTDVVGQPTAYEYCGVDTTWISLADVPESESELLDLRILRDERIGDVLGVNQDLVSTAWFASDDGRYLACTYTLDLNECRFSSKLTKVEFTRSPDGWVASRPILAVCGAED